MLQPILYWFPGKKKPEGLEHRFVGKYNSSNRSFGPVENKRGLLIGPYENCSSAYRPDSQTWHKRKNYWIGISNDDWHPIKIARCESFYPGEDVMLADGKLYNIPIANPFFESCSFNLKDVMDIDGNWQREVEPRFKKMSDKAITIIGNIVQSLLNNEKVDSGMNADECRNFVIEIIQINYNLTSEEISLLEISDPKQYWDVISAFCDAKTIQKMVVYHIEQAGLGNSASLNFLEMMAGGSSILDGAMDMTENMCPA